MDVEDIAGWSCELHCLAKPPRSWHDFPASSNKLTLSFFGFASLQSVIYKPYSREERFLRNRLCFNRPRHFSLFIIIFINWNWVVTRWQWLFCMYTNMEKKLLGNLSREGYVRGMQQQLGNLGTISAFARRHRETKKNLCRGGRSQDLPDTDFQPAVRHLK